MGKRLFIVTFTALIVGFATFGVGSLQGGLVQGPGAALANRPEQVITPTATPICAPFIVGCIPTAGVAGPTSTAVPTAVVQAAIRVVPSTQTAGSAFQVSGTGFHANDVVTISWAPSGAQQQSTAATDPNGAFSITMVIPINATPGTYTLTASDSTGRAATAALTVLANTQTIPPPPPPPVIATATLTPAPTATPLPSITILKVEILHKVKGKQKNTQSLKLHETANFVVMYSVSGVGTLKPSGTLIITKSGKRIKNLKMKSAKVSGQTAFSRKVHFTSTKYLGTLYAHFMLKVGTTQDRRDRRFKLSR